MVDVAASGGQRHAVNGGQGSEGKSQTSSNKPADQSRRELVQLKWLSTLVPGAAVLVYETVRYETLEHLLPGIPPIVGNVAVALLVLLLTYGFASFVFRVVERVQADAVRRGRELAALNAVIDERARLSRELHDGFAQLVAYMLVRLDTVTGLVEAHRANEAIVELERMRSVTDDLYHDVRESISELRTSVSERGLPDTLHEYVDEYEERHGITVSLQGEDAARGLPALVAFQLLRIVQEAPRGPRWNSATACPRSPMPAAYPVSSRLRAESARSFEHSDSVGTAPGYLAQRRPALVGVRCS
jgi:signal transduction histidine kinase